MSLLEDFKNDCPLTTLDLEKWLEAIIGNTFEVEESLLTTLYNTTQGRTPEGVTSAQVAEIVDAIKSGKHLATSAKATILSGTYFEVVGDDYINFKIVVFGTFGSTFEKIVFEVESLGGDIRLATKTVTTA